MSSFASLLAEVFAAQGWSTTRDAALEGRSGTVYAAPVLAERDGFVILIERRPPEVVVTEPLIEEMARVVADTGADMGVLAHLGPADEAAVRSAEGRIILWDRLTSALLVGETKIAVTGAGVLPDLPLGATAVSAPMAAPSTAMEVPSATPPPVEPEPVGGLADFFSAPVASEAPVAETSPEPAALDFDGLLPDAFAEPAPATPMQVPDESIMATFPSLSPRISARDAIAGVQDRLFSANGDVDLVLQPVHLFDYECDLLVEGSLEYDTVTGRVEVHGTNKSVRDVDPLWIDPAGAGPIAADPDVRTVDERPPRIKPERAAEIAHASLMKKHSRMVEIKTSDDDEDFVMMERKDVTPRPDQVRVRPLGLVLRPLWRVHGPNGACLVDAITKELVSEDLRTPDPDIIMLD